MIIFAVKLFGLATIIFIYNLIMQSVSHTIANELALNQMQNSVDSSWWFNMYTYISNNAWFLLLIIMVVMFYNDVIKFFIYIKEKVNEKR